MKNKAVRLYGVKDLRLEEFDLPELGQDGVRVEISPTAFACPVTRQHPWAPTTSVFPTMWQKTP